MNAVQGMASQMTLSAPAMTAPALKNMGTVPTQMQGGTVGDDKLYSLLTKLIEKIDNGGGGNTTIPIYLGNDLIDERIIKAEDRRTVRSGGRA